MPRVWSKKLRHFSKEEPVDFLKFFRLKHCQLNQQTKGRSDCISHSIKVIKNPRIKASKPQKGNLKVGRSTVTSSPLQPQPNQSPIYQKKRPPKQRPAIKSHIYIPRPNIFTNPYATLTIPKTTRQSTQSIQVKPNQTSKKKAGYCNGYTISIFTHP